MRINTYNNFDLVVKKYKSWKLMKLEVIMRMVLTPNKQLKCNNTYGRSPMRTPVVVRELRADSTNACKSNVNSNIMCSDPHK